MDKLHNAHVGAYKLSLNHDWHVTLYRLATFGRIDAARVWELDGVLTVDNDPFKEALFQSIQQEQEEVWKRIEKQAEEATKNRWERIDAKLQAALSPPPPPRAEPITPMADIATTAPVAASQTGAAVTASDGPLPLTTSEVAGCFAELHNWDAGKWKTNLQSPPKWLMACRKDVGRRDLPPPSRTTVLIVKSVNQENDGYEEKQIHRRADHRFHQAGRGWYAGQGVVPQRRFQRRHFLQVARQVRGHGRA